jgi:hypothetical protein
VLRGSIKILTLIFLLNAFSQSVEPEGFEDDFSFFPLQTGSFRTYFVVDTSYTSLGDTVIENYYLREWVKDSFPNSENGFTYLIERSKRKSLSDEWTVDSIWTARRNNINGIQIENNVPVVKIVFPVQDGKVWDGNALNTKNREEFTLERSSESIVITSPVSSMEFPEFAKVTQSDFIDGITVDDVRIEVFVPDIGLVYKQRLILQYNTDPEFLGSGVIDRGTDFEQWIIEYGFE